MADREAVVAVAEAQLSLWLEKIPVGQEESYGFHDRAELLGAKLGAPYQTWTLDPQRVQQDEATTGVALDEWRFPVQSGSGPRAFLTVAQVNGHWEAVDLGAAQLAAEIGRFEAEQSPRAETRRVLLRLYAFQADFVAAVPAGEPVENAALTPLRSARGLLKEQAGKTRLSLPELRAILRQRLGAPAPSQPVP